MNKKYINSETFVISVVCREDLEEYIGKKAYKLRDADMEAVATKMGDIMQEDYWNALHESLNILKIK